jgi:hypothetical protein
MGRRITCSLVGILIVGFNVVEVRPADNTPRAALVPIPSRAIEIPAEVDCSTPMVWDLVDGSPTFFAIASWGGLPVLLHGPELERLQRDGPITMVRHPGHGIWMEAVVPDDDGTWYGYYHHEVPAEVCGRPDRTTLNIGSARSRDHGLTWENLGLILDGPRDSVGCGSLNRFQLGGVGDPSVILDANHRYLYVYFSQYGKDRSAQGVAIARMAWADRDAPAGKLDVLQDGVWLPSRSVDQGSGPEWEYPHGTALVPVGNPWHDGDFAVDAFWGASIHWNTYLERYVMLLNRAKNEDFDNEGIYVSYSPTLDDPLAWSAPIKLINGGSWYPQVAGLEAGGTDRLAGRRARFFLGGQSSFYIQFSR